MRCPRCQGFVFQEKDDYGGTEFVCIAGHSWMAHASAPLDWSHPAREGNMKRQPPRMTRKTIDEQERSYEMRQAHQRIQNQRNRLKRQGLA